jgi:hypothetical protein
VTDAGVSLSFTAIKTLSCPTNDDYSGGFLTFNTGISGELIALPVGLGLSYSFGIDAKKFIQDLQRVKASGQFKLAEVRSELRAIGRSPSSALGHSDFAVFEYGVKLMAMLHPSLGVTDLGSAHGASVIRRSLIEKKSLGKSIKDLTRSPSLQRFFADQRLDHLRVFFSILANSLTGCDSLGGSGSLSLTLSPVSVGMAYSNYHLLADISLEKLNALSSITPLVLLNPFLLDPLDLKALVEVAREFTKVPQRFNQCGARQILRF